MNSYLVELIKDVQWILISPMFDLQFNERQLDEAYAEEDSQLQLFDEPIFQDSQELEDSQDEESQSILSWSLQKLINMQWLNFVVEL